MKNVCLTRIMLVVILCMVSAEYVFSTPVPQNRNKNKKIYEGIVSVYIDSLKLAADKYEKNSTLHFLYARRANPYYFRLFAPVTIYNKVLENAIFVEDEAPTTDGLIPFSCSSNMERNEEINATIDNTLMNIYLNEPCSVRYLESDIMEKNTFNEEISSDLPRKEQVMDQVTVVVPEAEPTMNETNKKPNFWTKSSNVYLQFTQGYISSNWYKGGESNNTMLSGFTLEANYNDQQKVQWDNKIEWKLGFITSRSDSLHKYKTNADLLRLTSKLGIQAIKHWYYTIQLQFYTQLFESYNSNDPELISTLLSPGYFTVDVGMDYKRSLKNLEFSAVIAPASYKLTYVRDDRVDETDFDVNEGKKIHNEIGSNIQITSKWKLFSQIEWESLITYFTTYSKVQAEWENTFNFTLNKYLTTKLFIHGRFDDSASRDDGHSYFQLSEMLSFGLSYTW